MRSADGDGRGRTRAASAAALVAVVLVVAVGWDPAVAVVVYLGPIAAATVLAVLVVADRVKGLERQLLLAGAVTVAGLAASVALFVEAMYVSEHDALFTVLLAGYGLVIGGWSAWLLGRRALRRLAAPERARRDVVTAVSHDLRTPITALRLLAEAVDDDIIDAGTRHEYLGRITTHVRALSAMIDELFELSRLEAGDVRWSMQRVLFNLIENAIRHTPAGGGVIVRAQPGQRQVQIEVADTGVGIPDEEREHVFDAFFRGGAHAARGDGGAGLGLAISRAIVEAHGGRIWLPGSGPGTRVRFSLPAARAHDRRHRGAEGASGAASVSTKRSSTGTMRSCASSWR